MTPKPARLQWDDRLLAAMGDVTAVVGRRVHHLQRAPGTVLSVSLNPLIMIFSVGYLFRDSITVPGSGNYSEFIMAGIAVQVGLSSVSPASLGVALDLDRGVTERMRTLPASRVALLFGYALAESILAALGLSIVMTVGLLMGWRSHEGFLSTVAGLLLIMAFTYTMVWVGVAMGLLVRNPESLGPLCVLILIFFSFLSNSFLAVQEMPAWARFIAEWNPVSAVVNLCRQLWGNPVTDTTSFPARNADLVAAVSLTAILILAILVATHAYCRALSR
ncbi:ABC transporter permease [Actinomadura madurae]|uniref:ABC transporter permease n=1 Tax=Actinomadura madurae TaxID=1993 RepID=UPI00399A920B